MKVEITNFVTVLKRHVGVAVAEGIDAAEVLWKTIIYEEERKIPRGDGTGPMGSGPMGRGRCGCMAGNGRTFESTGSGFEIADGGRGRMAKFGMTTGDAGATAQSIDHQAELLQQ